jgi:hypothetical protein
LVYGDSSTIFIPSFIILPFTFSSYDELNGVALFNVVLPETFNDDKNVDAPKKINY